MVLAAQNLPKEAPGGYALLDQLPMGVSRAVEGERVRQAREDELARSIQEIDAVAEARVHLAMPETSVFVRDNAAPSASVILKLQGGRSLSDAQVQSIINLVASSVPGMKPDSVTIVDQMGALLSKAGGTDPSDAAADQRIDFQRRIEDKYRLQLTQLLTPLVGANNFSAEVQADVNLDDTSSTRESYDKQGALRAEQGNWTADKGGAGGTPGGIPGTLSNTPPPASAITAPTGQTLPNATPASAATGTTPPAPGGPATAANGMPDSQKTADSYSRAYELGREVSVTRASPGQIKRLSVAVVLRDPDTGKPRSPAEIQQLTQLVRSAVGFDQTRNDQVTVISRKFAGAADDVKVSWYQAPWVPMVGRNVTALVIALLVLLLGVRPLAKTLLKKRDEAQARPALGQPAAVVDENGHVVAKAPPAVTIEAIENARSYDDRVGMVRGFTRDNPTRAALAVRDMIKADAQS
jgi:flagellar M-ring protein FliF